jgi:chromosome segregation ATPase
MKDKIFAICEQLKAEGVKVTQASVREALGSGSFSTIVPIIKEWRDNTSPAEIVQEIPAAAQNAANQAATLIWKIATEHQAEAINAIRQECARIEQEATAERDEAIAEIKRLESDKETENVKNNELFKDMNEAIKKLQKEVENARVAEQVCQARLETAAHEIEDLKAQIKEERAETKAANKKAAEMNGKIEIYEKQAIKKTTTPKKPEVKQ